MNNTPNNNQEKCQPSPASAVRPPQKPTDTRPAPNGVRPNAGNGGGSPNNARQAYFAPERNPSYKQPRRAPGSQESGGSLTSSFKFVIVWIAILAVVLAVILIIVFAKGGNDAKDDHIPANGTVSEEGTATEETEGTTEETTLFPVESAVMNDDTVQFASTLDFANGILIDRDTNTVLASKGGNDRIYPASMTKIMTLIVAAEAVEDLDETFTMTAKITNELYIAEASVAGFTAGEEITMRDLIYGLILPSGGDAALGLANHIAGSEEAFAEMMNKKAEELGLRNTHFTNCTGLHNSNHYSTCHEIALILEYAIKDDFMRTVLSTYQYTTEPTEEHPEGLLLTSTLFSRVYGDEAGTAFIIGGKTGYTIEARNCLASFATRCYEGEDEGAIYAREPNYILVTAGSSDKWAPVFSAIDVYKEFTKEEEPAVTAGVAGANDEDYDNQNNGKPDSDGDESLKIYTAADPY